MDNALGFARELEALVGDLHPAGYQANQIFQKMPGIMIASGQEVKQALRIFYGQKFRCSRSMR
jgi:hypothetical protein